MNTDAGQDSLWQVYLLQCADQSLYAGVTTDLARRRVQHNGQLAGGARYTKARRPVALVWSEACNSRSDAQQREHALRRLSREQKLALISGAKERG
jgi:putative endonuclease